MNTDWIAYLITAVAAMMLLAMFLIKKKRGSCCGKASCEALTSPQNERDKNKTS